MKILIFLITILLAGCSGQFLGGTATGGLGAAGGYEYNAHRQMQRIEEDLKTGKITREEYNIRKDQIEKGSLIK